MSRKKFSILVLLGLILFLCLFVFYNFFQTITVRGKITAYDAAASILEIIDDKEEVWSLSLKDSPVFLGIDGSPISSKLLRRGFEIEAVGRKNPDLFLKTRAIKIVHEPDFILKFPNSEEPVEPLFPVMGQSRVSSTEIFAELLDEQGNVLGREATLAGEFDSEGYGVFFMPFTYQSTTASSAILRLSSGESSSSLFSLPIKLSQKPMIYVKLFFTNSKTDPGALFCERVYPVRRMLYRQESDLSLVREVLDALVYGPNFDERGAGYHTSFNKNTRIRTVTLENRIVRVDFDQSLMQEVGGSCRVGAMRAQIEETVLALPFVDRVVVTMNGEEEGVFEP